MPNNAQKPVNHLAVALGGMVIGGLLAASKGNGEFRSRAHEDAPDEVEEVILEVGELLDEWEPDEDCESEDDFVNDLAAYLEEATGRDVEVTPATREGFPDILIDGLLALELKVAPGRNERNRLLGQCTGYSRLWPTWAVLIDSPPSAVNDFRQLIADSRLEQILVWDFS